MPITSCSPKLAKAINRMVEQLKLDYGVDFSYSVNGRGMTLVRSGLYGVNQPVPLVHPKSPKKKVDIL